MTSYERALLSFYTRIDSADQLHDGFRKTFESLAVQRHLVRGEILYSQGEALEKITLNLTGLFRSYDAQNELTLGFFRPLTLVPSVSLLREGEVLSMSVEALTAAKVLVLPYAAFLDLTRSDFRWYRILWNLLHEESIEREALRISLLVDTAQVRYRKFLESFGPLERHIRIGHVASYLGMSPATLSRIRSRRWSNAHF